MNSEKRIEGYQLAKGDKELLDRLQAVIMRYDAEKAKNLTQEIMEKKIDPLAVMNYAIANSARILGEKFESGEIFLPHLVLAGDIMSEVSTILETSMTPEESKKSAGKIVVIGTVEGDIHSIGKNIVAMLMKANGFKVYDLGVDVKSDVFVKQAEANKADIIAMSCLLTTTMPCQKEVMEELKHLSLRDKFKVMVGGGPITQEWANEIGADGFGKDAIEAVKVAKQLTKISWITTKNR